VIPGSSTECNGISGSGSPPDGLDQSMIIANALGSGPIKFVEMVGVIFIEY
jgi:hypothetical protein